MSSQPIVINIGAIPNDGTGDPLRTAFNDVNLNFANVFAYGPVLSNVQIANNTILTTNVNGNLVLAPNGTGVVQSNVNIIPNTANIRNLGSATNRWATVYAQYLDVSANLNVTGNIIYNGDLTVDGNLTVQGNIIQVGNIVTETLTIQLANAASTANAANGSGITVGATDNIATLLYNSTGNVWTTNIGVSSVGNISAPYLFGNGSQLTGLAATYGNANVVTLLAGFGSNTISTTGNITSGNLISPTLNNSGNISVVASGNTWTFSTDGTTRFPTGGLISNYPGIPGANDSWFVTSGNGTGGISSQDGQQYIQVNNDLFVEIGAGYGTANAFVWQFGLDGTFATDGNINTTGNVSANFFLGNGSQLTGISTANTGNVTFNDVNIIGDGNLYLQPDPANADAYLDIYLTTGPDIHIAGNGESVILGTDDYANVTVNVDGNVSIQASNGTPQVWTFDAAGNLTLPFGATLKDTSGDSVAFGQNAGANNQSQHSVAIGPEAGMNNQGEDSVAIGWLAGRDDQTSFSIAIGWNAGSNTQGQLAQAYGRNAGAYYQKNSAIAMGYDAARYLQGQSAIAIGSNAGYGGPQGTTVASMPSPDVVRVFGSTSTLYNGMTAVGGSIEPTTGITIVGLSGEDITLSSVPATPLTNGTTLYFYPAQGTGGVAIGSGSAQALQGQNAVAVGYRAGQTRQGNSSVSIGEDAGYTTQGANAVSIGSAAGFDTQGATAISIGLNAGRTTQGQASIAMGFSAGFTGQGNSSVALGEEAGYTGQGQNSIAIGRSAGQSSQGNSAIAMGWTAAQTTQGNAAVAIGEDAGRYYQGEYSIAIGRTAGFNLQANNSIILNATGLHVNATTANSFIVQPIRNSATGNVLYYDEFTGEITFDVGGSGGLPVANGTSNFDIATANGNATITANSGNTWTFDTTGNLTVPSGGSIFSIGSNGIGVTANATSGNAYLALGDAVSQATLSGNVGVNIVTNGNIIWNFNAAGNATFPNGAVFTGYDLYAAANSYVELAGYTGNTYVGVDNTSAFIQTDWNGAQYQWNFLANGVMTAPGAISATGNIIGGNIVTSGSGGDITLTGGNITGAFRVVTTPTALANLTAVAGGRAFVNNANLIAAGNFGNQVGSGGSNTVPVWSDGSNWYIG